MKRMLEIAFCVGSKEITETKGRKYLQLEAHFDNLKMVGIVAITIGKDETDISGEFFCGLVLPVIHIGLYEKDEVSRSD